MPIPCSSPRMSITRSTIRNGYRCGSILSTIAMSAASRLVTILFITTVSFVRRFATAFLACESGEGRHFTEPLLHRFCRCAAPTRAGGHVAVDIADRRDLRPFADRHVVVQADPRTQYDKILQRRTAGYARLRYQNAMAANSDIVAYLDQVVDLGAFADHRVANGA